MTLRTSSTPLDRLTLDEKRATVSEWSGVSYANLATASQTELDLIINHVNEYVSERTGHYPWAKREYSTTLTAGVQMLPMPADFRSMKTITETASGLTALAHITDKDTWRRAWGDVGRATHPWADDSVIRWFFDGMNDAATPLQQWKRSAVSTVDVTVLFDYVPYFGLESEGLCEIPSHAMRPIIHLCRSLWASFRHEYDVVAQEDALAEKFIAANQIADDLEGAADVDRYVDAPDWFFRECSGP